MNKTLLFNILAIESESYNCRAMAQFITDHSLACGYEVAEDMHGNLYVTKGKADTYPCIASHMDTVHAIHGDGIYIIEIGDNVTGMNPRTMEQTGIGGDDKCGIYAALHCLASLPACKAAFFVDEETGCEGSAACDLDFFSNCRFILQADRRGSTDFVDDINGPLASKDFAKAIKPLLKRHGFKPCAGAMTDVQELRNRNVGVSVANMSAGYHRPHSPDEYISLTQLANTCALMLSICCLPQSFPFIAPPRLKRNPWQYAKASKWLAGKPVTEGMQPAPAIPDWTPASILDQWNFDEDGMLIETPEDEKDLAAVWPHV